MVELQRQQLEVLAEMAQLNADAEKVATWRFRWVTVPLLALTVLTAALVPLAIELLR